MAYQPAWQGGLIWDDDAHVTRPDLRSGRGLYRIWFELGATQQYYPLLHSAFWIEHKLWGGATLGYHLVNILLHAAAAVMVALILRRLAIPGALLAAAIFALHPVHVESVAWITEQKNTLSAVFYLGAMLVYLRFDQTRRRSLYCWALGLFLLGLLAKTVTATLPAALLLIFWWQRGKLSWRRDVLPLVPFFGLGLVAGVFTAWVERKLIGAEGAAFELTIAERCLLAGRVIWFYLGKLLWPTELIFIYPRWHVSPAVWWQYLFPAAVLVLLAGLWLLRRRWRGPLAAVLYFVGTLFPVLGFCNVYPFLFSFVADHFQYLASLGMITLAAAGTALLLDWWRLWHRPTGYVLCVVLLTSLMGLTWRQSRMYLDRETLYRATINENPDCWMAHDGLGVALARRGQVDGAIAHFQQALKIKPDYADAHSNLGVALAGRGRFDEAIAHFQQALETMPDHADVHGNLGVALARRGQVDEAIAHFRQALKIKPGDAEVHYELAVALESRRQFAEAMFHYRKDLEIRPQHAEAHNNLAWLLATCPVASLRNGAKAVQHALQANKLSGGKQPDILDTLAAAYAEAGRFPEALAAARAALELATRRNNRPLADALRAQIARYEAGQPFRQTPSTSGR
jgi:Flp pilus assembly protein TadD